MGLSRGGRNILLVRIQSLRLIPAQIVNTRRKFVVDDIPAFKLAPLEYTRE